MELKLICHDKWTGLLQHITVSPLQHDLQSESEASSLCTRILSDLIMAWLKEEYKMNVLCSLLSKKKIKAPQVFYALRTRPFVRLGCRVEGELELVQWKSVLLAGIEI